VALFWRELGIAARKIPCIEPRWSGIPDVNKKLALGCQRQACSSAARLTDRVHPFPAATHLPSTILRPKLASRVGHEQLAGIEPMFGGRATEDRRERAGEIGDVRAAVVPERPTIG